MRVKVATGTAHRLVEHGALVECCVQHHGCFLAGGSQSKLDLAHDYSPGFVEVGLRVDANDVAIFVEVEQLEAFADLDLRR